MKLQAKDLIQYGTLLKVKFSVTNFDTVVSWEKIESPEYIIRRSAVFQTRVEVVRVGSSRDFIIFLFIRFAKLRQDEDLTYTIKIASKLLKSFLAKQVSSIDGNVWHLMNEETQNCSQLPSYEFDFTVLMDFIPRISAFATLCEYTEQSDFELKGDDGSVHMHRAVLATSSPVLKGMLSETWKETTEGQVAVPGTSRATLQNFKDYVYLHTLPKSGLEQLLLLASYYMMPDLEQKCENQLANSLKAQNACELLEFACNHKATTLMTAILEWVQSGIVKVGEIKVCNKSQE